MTLDDVITFVTQNPGRKILTIGGRVSFTVEQRGNALVFITRSGKTRNESYKWIRKSLQVFNQIGSFKLGDYSHTRNGSYVLALFREIVACQKHQPANTLATDLKAIMARPVDVTAKEALVQARIGQGKFRSDLLALWGDCCAVTKSITCEAIRASHIKPWSESTDTERLDPANGLPLTASLDALFDAGLISFDDSGRMLVSSNLAARERAIFGLIDASLRSPPPPKTVAYLQYHRANHFRA